MTEFDERAKRARSPEGFERSPASRALDSVVAEAREHLEPSGAEVDWARVEDRVMTAVERDKPMLLRKASRSREALLRGAAVALAAAAVFALFVRKDRETLGVADGVVEGSRASADGAPASALRTTEGSGEVRVNRVVATPGYVVHAGDAIEVEGVQAVFERSRPTCEINQRTKSQTTQVSAVTWLLDGSAQVKGAGESLILALENGAIEAQVAPVPVGEAFGVDIATERGVVRVAVHGTHLRVARTGTRVTVDLTEGVVSIGVPPRTGVTYGTLVTAPAHVELDATDLATLRVDHSPASVREAVPLRLDTPVIGRVDPPSTPALPASPPPASTAMASRGALARPESTSASSDPRARAGEASAKSPRDTIAGAVRDCAAARGRSGDVHVTVTSNLRLRVSSAGEVETAQFTPPLLPEIQTCAASSIYKTKLDDTGLVTIPIEFSY
jgi:hypothetical protein